MDGFTERHIYRQDAFWNNAIDVFENLSCIKAYLSDKLQRNYARVPNISDSLH
tara:strand:+ start:353 stop:511 length:159 start_codon:yes stop_codon:yes gene_type:complete